MTPQDYEAARAEAARRGLLNPDGSVPVMFTDGMRGSGGLDTLARIPLRTDIPAGPQLRRTNRRVSPLETLGVMAADVPRAIAGVPRVIGDGLRAVGEYQPYASSERSIDAAAARAQNERLWSPENPNLVTVTAPKRDRSLLERVELAGANAIDALKPAGDVAQGIVYESTIAPLDRLENRYLGIEAALERGDDEYARELSTGATGDVILQGVNLAGLVAPAAIARGGGVAGDVARGEQAADRVISAMQPATAADEAAHAAAVADTAPFSAVRLPPGETPEGRLAWVRANIEGMGGGADGEARHIAMRRQQMEGMSPRDPFYPVFLEDIRAAESRAYTRAAPSSASKGMAEAYPEIYGAASVDDATQAVDPIGERIDIGGVMGPKDDGRALALEARQDAGFDRFSRRPTDDINLDDPQASPEITRAFVRQSPPEPTYTPVGVGNRALENSDGYPVSDFRLVTPEGEIDRIQGNAWRLRDRPDPIMMEGGRAPAVVSSGNARSGAPQADILARVDRIAAGPQSVRAPRQGVESVNGTGAGAEPRRTGRPPHPMQARILELAQTRTPTEIAAETGVSIKTIGPILARNNVTRVVKTNTRDEARNARIFELLDEMQPAGGNKGGRNPKDNSYRVIAERMKAEGFDNVTTSTISGVVRRGRAAPGADAADDVVSAAVDLGISPERYRALSVRGSGRANDATNAALIGGAAGGLALQAGSEAEAQALPEDAQDGERMDPPWDLQPNEWRLANGEQLSDFPAGYDFSEFKPTGVPRERVRLENGEYGVKASLEAPDGRQLGVVYGSNGDVLGVMTVDQPTPNAGPGYNPVGRQTPFPEGVPDIDEDLDPADADDLEAPDDDGPNSLITGGSALLAALLSRRAGGAGLRGAERSALARGGRPISYPTRLAADVGASTAGGVAGGAAAEELQGGDWRDGAILGGVAGLAAGAGAEAVTREARRWDDVMRFADEIEGMDPRTLRTTVAGLDPSDNRTIMSRDANGQIIYPTPVSVAPLGAPDAFITDPASRDILAPIGPSMRRRFETELTPSGREVPRDLADREALQAQMVEEGVLAPIPLDLQRAEAINRAGSWAATPSEASRRALATDPVGPARRTPLATPGAASPEARAARMEADRAAGVGVYAPEAVARRAAADAAAAEAAAANNAAAAAVRRERGLLGLPDDAPVPPPSPPGLTPIDPDGTWPEVDPMVAEWARAGGTGEVRDGANVLDWRGMRERQAQHLERAGKTAEAAEVRRLSEIPFRASMARRDMLNRIELTPVPDAPRPQPDRRTVRLGGPAAEVAHPTPGMKPIRFIDPADMRAALNDVRRENPLGGLRWAVDDAGELHVWNADAALHDQVAEALERTFVATGEATRPDQLAAAASAQGKVRAGKPITAADTKGADVAGGRILDPVDLGTPGDRITMSSAPGNRAAAAAENPALEPARGIPPVEGRPGIEERARPGAFLKGRMTAKEAPKPAAGERRPLRTVPAEQEQLARDVVEITGNEAFAPVFKRDGTLNSAATVARIEQAIKADPRVGPRLREIWKDSGIPLAVLLGAGVGLSQDDDLLAPVALR